MISNRLLTFVPTDWTELQQVISSLPPHDGDTNDLLAAMERRGEIETRMRTSPSRVEIRRKPRGAGSGD